MSVTGPSEAAIETAARAKCAADNGYDAWDGIGRFEQVTRRAEARRWYEVWAPLLTPASPEDFDPAEPDCWRCGAPNPTLPERRRRAAARRAVTTDG